MVGTRIIPLDEIPIGERIIGVNKEKEIVDECEVVSITNLGEGEVYGNYTADHYVLASGESNELSVYGTAGEPRTATKHQILTTCPLAVDESGQMASMSICGKGAYMCQCVYIIFHVVVILIPPQHQTSPVLYQGGPIPWDIYLIIYDTLLKIVKETGINSLDALRDLQYASAHLPSLCTSAVQCSETNECEDFEKYMLDFVNVELTYDAQMKVWKAFPDLGHVYKAGSMAQRLFSVETKASESGAAV